MNNIIKLGVALLAVASMGCKKYGFNVADGYGKDTLTQNITVDTTDSHPDFSMLNQARIFPGIVDPSEPRLQNYQVTINMNYLDESKTNRLRISVAPQPVFCTGVYAAPGESVAILVPANGKGLSCQIGMWTDDLTGQSPLLRAPVITTSKQLFPGLNYVRNLYGGNIYIRASFPIAQPVTLTINGACKAPDFQLNVTDPAQWKQAILTTKVPWFDFYSNNIDFTLPTDKMKAFLQSSNVDPVAELKEWDSILRYDYEGWIGLSDTASNPVDKLQTLPQRIVLDIQPVVGYGHNGYPVVATDDGEWFGAAMQATDTSVSLWGTLHEMGHNYQQTSFWVWGGIGETSNNIHSFKRAMRMGIQNRAALHPAMPGATAAALAYTALPNAGKRLDIDFATGNAPFVKIVMFLQLLDKEGWGFWSYLNTRARHAQYSSISDIDKHDFLYEAISEYTHTDFYKFFQAWGVQLSSQAMNQIAAEYPNKLAYDIWQYNPLTRTGGNDLIVYEIDRTKWTVTSQTAGGDPVNGDQEMTDETTNADPTNGHFSSMFDGDNSTYWHSEYSYDNYNQPTSYPHILTIDMKQAYPVSDIYFIQRAAGSRNVKMLDIWVGNDPNAMQKVVSNGVLAQNVTTQKISIGATQTVRYFKVVFNSAYDGQQFAAMAEMGIN